MKIIKHFEIMENKKISSDVYDMTVFCPELAEMSKPGQFVNIYLDSEAHILPRPISICEIDNPAGALRFVYRIAGEGTKMMSELTKGQKVKILAPLGNSFKISSKDRKICLAGGGIGVPPLLALLRTIRQGAPNVDVSVFLGFRTEPVLEEEFKKYGASVYVSTDDGSAGFHGNIVDLMERTCEKYDVVYSCGPKVMLKHVAEWAATHHTRCYVSMEERMACGVGACVGCVVKIKDGGHFVYQKVCKDGPVFNAAEVIWE